MADRASGRNGASGTRAASRASSRVSRDEKTRAPRRDELLGVELSKPGWFVPVKPKVRLDPGAVPEKNFLTIPQVDAQALLRDTVRLVADLPVGSSLRVVWSQAGSELLLDLGRTTIECRVGLVRITLSIGCDQLDGLVPVVVPIGVGTADAPNGLVMSSFSALDGPPAIVGQWSEALTAFAWESLLELARRLCGAQGHDASGRPLVPGAVGSGSGVLLVQPMARHDLSRLGG